jgi:2-keto-4-pentenoate hydratase/2-oxohepta-3-ene-1,7-dioic acid hydratase in catechol pathway
MRFRTVTLDGRRATVGVREDGSFALVDPDRAVDDALRAGPLAGLWHGDRPALANLPTVAPARTEALVHRPRKLWGIGLNYREHAGDLAETAPTEPASFLKGDHTLIGADDAIVLPAGSTRTTAEAELGLVIGRRAYQVTAAEAMSHVAGVCLVLDQTEEEILRRNPRFLTRAKNFPTFLSLGPDLVTLDEALRHVAGDLLRLRVETLLDGEVVRANLVANMTFPPADLVAFHSRMMPLYPGDVICTGTPGAVVLAPGRTPGCRIEGIGTLTNPVLAADDARATAQLRSL